MNILNYNSSNSRVDIVERVVTITKIMKYQQQLGIGNMNTILNYNSSNR